MFEYTRNKSLSDVKDTLLRLRVDDAQFLAYYNSRPSLTQSCIKKILSIPTCDAAPSFPQEMSDMHAGFVANAYSQIKSERNNLNNANALDSFVAYSNLNPTVTVEYLRGEVTMVDDNKKTTTYTSHANMIATREPGLLPLNATKIEFAQKVCTMGEFKKERPSDAKAVFKVRVISGKTISVKNLMSQGMPSSPPVTVLTGMKMDMETTGSVLEQVRAIASYSGFTQFAKVIVSEEGNLVPIHMPNYPDCGTNFKNFDSLLQALNPCKQVNSLLKFYDIPSQWLNAPMKWGAILSYFNNGTLTNPVGAPSDSDYFGAKGGRAFQLFTKSLKYDIDNNTPLIFGKNVDEDKKKRMQAIYPNWLLKNIFSHEVGDRYLFSDVWSNKFTEFEITKLVGFVNPKSAIKFVGNVTTVLTAMRDLGKFPCAILVTSRPLFMEYFLTQRIDNRVDPAHIGKYIYYCKNLEEMVNSFRHFYIRVITSREYYKFLLTQSVKTSIQRDFRPFPVRSWMMPMLVTTGRNKAMEGKSKSLTLNDLAAITGIKALQEELLLDEDEIPANPIQTAPPRVSSAPTQFNFGGFSANVVEDSEMLNELLGDSGGVSQNAFGLNTVQITTNTVLAPSPSPQPPPNNNRSMQATAPPYFPSNNSSFNPSFGSFSQFVPNNYVNNNNNLPPPYPPINNNLSNVPAPLPTLIPHHTGVGRGSAPNSLRGSRGKEFVFKPVDNNV